MQSSPSGVGAAPGAPVRSFVSAAAQTHAERRAADRLLRVLAEPGAYAGASDAPGLPQLAVFASRRGVTMRVASAAPATLETLARDGLIGWSGQGVARRAMATAEGVARARRLGENNAEQAFLAQHRPLRRVVDETSGQGVCLDDGESPLLWLARRKDKLGRPLLDAARFEAGERLRRDLTAAQMLPRVTANWSASVASGARGQGGAHQSEVVVAARQRARRALDAVGDDFAGLLLDVCGFLKGLELIERERSWPPRAARIVLGLALGRLAGHYGLACEARGPARGKGLRSWGADDYRPTISPD